MNKIWNIVVLGAGRIAAVHTANMQRHPQMRVCGIYDVNHERARNLAKVCSAIVIEDVEKIWNDPSIDAICIASSTDTHAEFLCKAAESGKAIFCEKPVSLDLAECDRCAAIVEQNAAFCFIGFNRRFDPHFASLKTRLMNGEVGNIELLQICSRDPGAPPAEYIRSSGGLFKDMMIHDLDMARHLLPEEPISIYASASCLTDPAIKELGDVDTAVVTLRTASGIQCQISNSRRAVYGYDQRIEVLGSTGMLRVENPRPLTVESWTEQGVSTEKPHWFFLERYEEAYRHELAFFVDCLNNGTVPYPSIQDGRQALVLAEAAAESLASGREVSVCRSLVEA
ncbi:MAG: inositol 2-dehydrogenase [Waddliaceae bacterium]|nr:inositol 2-dehydrogenase [Waddliaceae bacterium]